MFERYAESARRVLFFSRYEASEFGSGSIEAEHLLLGLARERIHSAGRMLSSLPMDDIRRDIESRRPRREKIPTSVEIPFSTEMTRVLHYAAEEADRLQHRHIGPEHLLLGLMREEGSVAATVLNAHGFRLDALRQQLVQLGPEPPSSSPVVHLQRSAFEHSLHRIKELVEALARAPRESSEARALLARILRELDSLEDGM